MYTPNCQIRPLSSKKRLGGSQIAAPLSPCSVAIDLRDYSLFTSHSLSHIRRGLHGNSQDEADRAACRT